MSQSTANAMAKVAKKVKRSETASVHVQTSKEDIIKLILADHEPLKRLIGTLKDLKTPIRTRRRIFEQFAPLFRLHAKAEQEGLYAFLKDENKELRIDGLKGDVEHRIAENLIEELKMSTDADLWSARCKVLAELVEHHIQEEEFKILPVFKKECAVEERYRDYKPSNLIQ